MAHRIAVSSKTQMPDARARSRAKSLNDKGFPEIKDVQLIDIYTIDADLSKSQLESVAAMLTHPVTQEYSIDKYLPLSKFNSAFEKGFGPGVTDNVAKTTEQLIEMLLGRKFMAGEGVYTSQLELLSGNLSEDTVNSIADGSINPIINRKHVKSYEQYMKDGGMDFIVPKVKLKAHPQADEVEILNKTDEDLEILGKLGVPNPDGTRRGPPALDLTYMKEIQRYFRDFKGRNPTDIEFESLAQTWSEHCHHTIFADPMDDIKEGLFKTYIKGATNRIRELKKQEGKRDFCVSVFTDNAGIIEFDNQTNLVYKIETHNTPSALDPYGGSITGIVGVNRDPLGTGMGALNNGNTYIFCMGLPTDTRPLFKGKNSTQRMLSPRRIFDGVVEGVKDGGNYSGMPTTNGGVCVDERYRGKPLVFVGTWGTIPTTVAGKPSEDKAAQPGDYIVMVGGRVGKDDIHGATFSSEALNEGSPPGAVQIGDPITQKKMSDALVKEARDRELYTSITDNGAGGLSCSVAEMAKECGGCRVKLDDVPLKYPGLAPWEILISESQERMTLSVPKEKWNEFSGLMESRGVEATVIGEFTNSGNCVVEYGGKAVMDIEMDFLHNGLPQRPMFTTYTRPVHEEPEIPEVADLTGYLHSMLSRFNIASFEHISQQYDYEVQGGSVLKPLQGRGRVNGDACVSRPVLDSYRGVVLSSGVYPTYGDIDTYHMTACAIDTAVRNAIAAGANLDHLALLDNFCWCGSNKSERQGQLVASVQACYDYAVEYRTPFISGKDSMFNTFQGFDENGNPIMIDVPPTVLASSIGVIPDSRKAVSLDAKFAGDDVYVLNETFEELGGSEYFASLGFVGNNVPKVNVERNLRLYRALSECINEGIIASAQSVTKGGLAVALAKTAMGGRLGMDVSLENLPGEVSKDEFALFSESQGRIVVTAAPQYAEKLRKIMGENALANIGKVTEDNAFIVRGIYGNEIINTKVDSMLESYKSTFAGY